MHDFRHRFAIRTLLDWYREGKDVEQQLCETCSKYESCVCRDRLRTCMSSIMRNRSEVIANSLDKRDAARGQQHHLAKGKRF